MAKPSAATKSQKRRRPKKRSAIPTSTLMIGNGRMHAGNLSDRTLNVVNRATSSSDIISSRLRLEFGACQPGRVFLVIRDLIADFEEQANILDRAG